MEEFRLLARQRGIKDETIAILERNEITSEDLLVTIREDEIDGLATVSLGQKAGLRRWIKELVETAVMAVPESGVPAPEARVSVPEAGVSAPEAGVSAPEAGVSAPEVGVSALEAGVSAPEAGVSAPEAGVSAPEAGVSGVAPAQAHEAVPGAAVNISSESSMSEGTDDGEDDDQNRTSYVYTGDERKDIREQQRERHGAIQEVEEKESLPKRAMQFIIHKARRRKTFVMNIGVIGESCVGKSTLINTLCGRKDNVIGAAGPREVGQPEAFTCPKFEKHRLWDFPQMTTSSMVTDGWLNSPDFKRYAGFVIVTSTTFSESDKVFAVEARKRNKMVFMLRTKLDIETNTAEENNASEVRQAAIETLAETELEQARVYLVSGLLKNWNDWDGQIFENDIREWITVATCVHSMGMTAAADDITHYVVQNGMQGLNDHLETTLSSYKENNFHIAVTGQPGSGKSTLINTIRRLKDGEEGAAETDITECTREPTPYPFPQQTNTCLWDLPGAGTLSFPSETYTQKVQFKTYDAVLIIMDNRILETDFKLAKEAQERKIPFYVVRSRIDITVREHRHKKTQVTEEAKLDELKRNIKKKFKDQNLPSEQVYLISSRLKYCGKWDFRYLMHDLVANTAASSRDTILYLAISCSEEILEMKQQQLKQRINKVVVRSILSGDGYTEILMNEFKLYQEAMGISVSGLDVEDMPQLQHDLQVKLEKLNEYAASESDESMLAKLWDIFGQGPKSKAARGRKQVASKVEGILNTVLFECYKAALGIIQEKL